MMSEETSKNIVDGNFFDELRNNSLKGLEKKDIDEFYRKYFNELKNSMDVEVSISRNDYGINTAIFVDKNNKPEKVLEHINRNLGKNLNDFIEEKFDENPKKFNRNFVTFENEINNNRLILRW